MRSGQECETGRPHARSAALVRVSLALSVVPLLLSPRPAGTQSAEPNVTLALRSRPLQESAEKLTKEGGDRVEVAPEAAEWKSTVHYTGPLPPVLRALSLQFHLQLTEESPPPTGPRRWQLRLSEEEKQRLRAEAAKRERARRKAAADGAARLQAVFRNIREWRTHPDRYDRAKLPPWDDTVHEFVDSLGPPLFVALTTVPEFVDTVGFMGHTSVALPVRRMTPGQQERLRKVLNAPQRGRAGDPQKREGSRGAQRWEEHLPHLGRARVRVRMHKSSRSWMLVGTVQFRGSDWSPDFFLFGAGEDPKPPPQQPVPPPAPARILDPLDRKPLRLGFRGASYAEVCAALSRALGRPVVADGVSVGERLTLAEQPQATLADVLGHVEARFGVEHRWSEGILLLRSREWEARVEEEPVATVLDLVEAWHKEQFLAVTPRHWLALTPRMNRRQVLGLRRAEKEEQRRSIAEGLGRSWDLWRFAAMLRPEQQEALLGQGLATRVLSLQQRQAVGRIVQREALEEEWAETAVLRIRAEALRSRALLELRDRNGEVLGELD